MKCVKRNVREAEREREIVLITPINQLKHLESSIDKSEDEHPETLISSNSLKLLFRMFVTNFIAPRAILI
jgi:hypothetical protein